MDVVEIVIIGGIHDQGAHLFYRIIGLDQGFNYFAKKS